MREKSVNDHVNLVSLFFTLLFFFSHFLRIKALAVFSRSFLSTPFLPPLSHILFVFE